MPDICVIVHRDGLTRGWAASRHSSGRDVQLSYGDIGHASDVAFSILSPSRLALNLHRTRA